MYVEYVNTYTRSFNKSVQRTPFYSSGLHEHGEMQTCINVECSYLNSMCRYLKEVQCNITRAWCSLSHM